MCGKIIEFVSDLFLCLRNVAFHFLFIVVFFNVPECVYYRNYYHYLRLV